MVEEGLAYLGYITLAHSRQINTTKSKEMILGPLARSNLSAPTSTIDRVTYFKLLGLHIDSSLSWANQPYCHYDSKSFQ